MAHLWTASADGGWEALALRGDARNLPDLIDVLVRCADGMGDDAWVLLTAPDSRVLINGLPLSHGIAVLADRDEIRLLPPLDQFDRIAKPFYFSTERLAVVDTYPAGRGGSCPRCKQPVAAGEPAVCCPGCGLWHHSTDALPCWTYADHCAACAQPTALDAGFRWTPEEL